MTGVIPLGQVEPTAQDFRRDLIESLRPFIGEGRADAMVVNLEAVVSNAASAAATKVVRPVFIASIAGTVITLLGLVILRRR